MLTQASTPYVTINEAARATGVSSIYIRNGCRDGSIAHIKSGRKYLVNMPRLLEKLDEDSTARENGGE